MLAIRAEDNLADEFDLVPFQCGDQLARFEVPDPHRFIAAGGGEPLAIRAEVASEQFVRRAIEPKRKLSAVAASQSLTSPVRCRTSSIWA